MPTENPSAAASGPTIEELQAENEQLKKRLASAPIAAALEPEIRRRMQAGLTKDEAEQCAKAQFEWDRALERQHKLPKGSVTNGELPAAK